MADQFFSYDAPMPDAPAMHQTYYDPSRLINLAKSAGPQDFSDAIPFWKRPEPIRQTYDANETYPAPPPVLPVTEHVKHRRTRSGCLTCRARRVKVRNSWYPFHFPLVKEDILKPKAEPRLAMYSQHPMSGTGQST